MTSRKRLLIPGAIFVGAFLIGILHGGRFSLWDDEGFSVAAAHLHISNLFSFTRQRDPHTGLYHVLLHYWIALNGDGETWIRSLSAIFSAAAAVSLWAFARRLFGNGVAIAATVLFVINGSYEGFAQEARPYALAEFLTCAGMYLLVRAVAVQTTKSWIQWSIVTALAVYAHPFAVIPVIGAYFSLLFASSRPSLRNLLWALVVQAALCSPLVWMLATQTVSHINWITGLSLEHLGGAALVITGRGGVGMVLLVGILVITLLVKTLLKLRSHKNAWAESLVLLWGLLLPVGLVLADLVKHVLVSRYLVPALPGMMLAAVLGISSLGSREYRWGAAILTAGFALVSVNTYFTHGTKDDWRDAAIYIRQQAQPGDAIIVSNNQFNVFRYYFVKNGGAAGSPPIPISPRRDWNSTIQVHENFINTTSPVDVAQAVAPYTCVWFLYLNSEPVQVNLQMGLKTVYNNQHTEQFNPRVDATLFSNSATGATAN